MHQTHAEVMLPQRTRKINISRSPEFSRVRAHKLLNCVETQQPVLRSRSPFFNSSFDADEESCGPTSQFRIGRHALFPDVLDDIML